MFCNFFSHFLENEQTSVMREILYIMIFILNHLCSFLTILHSIIIRFLSFSPSIKVKKVCSFFFLSFFFYYFILFQEDSGYGVLMAVLTSPSLDGSNLLTRYIKEKPLCSCLPFKKKWNKKKTFS